MISFENDYSEGAHPRILRLLTETNLTQRPGYGKDETCAQAIGLLQGLLEQPEADIHFLSGGTSANLIALSAFLRPHEAIIAARSAHINVHETGAIEATGHKILPISAPDGKLGATQLDAILKAHTDEHMVKPRLVFISNATELGTHYAKQELYALREHCDQHGLLLYMDGARLGNALAASDLTWPDIAACCDAFYIGGTKNGALFGEAMVIVNKALSHDFRYLIKQRGGMMAKGFLLGLQFHALFEDDLYLENARHANAMADALRKGIADAGYSFLTHTRTNQLFPIFPNTLIRALRKHYAFHDQAEVPGKQTAVRLVTSWATPQSAVTAFLDDLKSHQL